MNGTYLSLFSGIGGLDLAVESHGYTCVGQVEWDDHATRVLERWWPDVPRWGDIDDVRASAYAYIRGQQELLREPQPAGVGSARGHEPDGRDPLGPDLIIGGFPCQPASTAGRRKGTADDRWLWPQFARVIGELGPRYVLVENVPGLTTVNGGRAFSEVLGTLADLGYDATWTSLRASDVGAPHRRQRLFLLAHTRHDGVDHSLRGEPGNGSRGQSPAQGDALGDTHDGGHTPVLRQAHLTGPEAEGKAGAEPGGPSGRVATDTAIDGHERDWPVATEGPQDGSHLGEGQADREGFPWGAYGTAVSRWENVMGPAPHPVDDKGRLHPPFVEWMMGFPPSWTDRSTRTQALKQLGNAVVPQQGAAALSILKELV